jgi:hypothetical protein
MSVFLYDSTVSPLCGGSASVDSANLESKMCEKNCVCTEHVQAFSLVIIPSTTECNDHLYYTYIILGTKSYRKIGSIKEGDREVA